MKLEIKEIEIKNFFSVGSKPIKIIYEPGLHAVTGRVIGQPTNNGVGKSAIFIDSLIFGFFGKSVRGLTQSGIVNSINEKDCYVHIKFILDNIPYRIERGLKPNYLYLINETEDNKEHNAKKLTQDDINNLLNINYTSFINMITLNINYSQSFFKMKAEQKRDFLENLLNISIYAKMFDNCKEDFNDLKHSINTQEAVLKTEIQAYKSKLDSYKKIDELKQQFEQQQKLSIEKITNDIKKLEDQLNSINISDVNYDDVLDNLNNDINEQVRIINVLNINISNNKKEITNNDNLIKKLTASPVCSECGTPTTSDHVTSHIKSLQDNNLELKNKNIEDQNKIDSHTVNKTKLTTEFYTIKDKKDKKNNQVTQKNIIVNNINNLKNNLKNEQNKSFNMSIISKDELITMKSAIEERKKTYDDQKKQFKISEYMKDVLGDKGVKKFVISKILPLLNKKMNHHLAILKAHYTIKFDNELNEVIKSRNRDVFCYENFSAGEQKRIDLAWMFTILDISKLRNSVECNVLIMDEILDSSMCANGIDSLMNYIKLDFKTVNKDMCIYVITHKNEINNEMFDNVIKLKKENHFTKLDV
jgi:DNA repair exonuclease SbcCD ATPase subunit